MPYKSGDRVERIESRIRVAATVLEVQDGIEEPVLWLEYDEGGTGWWPASAVRPLATTRSASHETQ